MKIHLKAVVRAISSNIKEEIDIDSPETVHPLDNEDVCRRRLDHIVKGFSLLIFYCIRGVKDSLHTCTEDVFSASFTVMESFMVDEADEARDTRANLIKTYVIGRIISGTLRNIIYYVHPKNSLLIWSSVLNPLNDFLKKPSDYVLRNKLFLLFLVEYLIYMISNSKSRLIEVELVKAKISGIYISVVCNICDVYFSKGTSIISPSYTQRARVLFFHSCKVFHMDKRFLDKVRILKTVKFLFKFKMKVKICLKLTKMIKLKVQMIILKNQMLLKMMMNQLLRIFPN
jgi:hypothetical protein